jgi:predicted outer membrane repeat protein
MDSAIGRDGTTGIDTSRAGDALAQTMDGSVGEIDMASTLADTNLIAQTDALLPDDATLDVAVQSQFDVGTSLDASPAQLDAAISLADAFPASLDLSPSLLDTASTLQVDAGSVSLVGLWDGSYLTNGVTGISVPFQVVIDPSNKAYLSLLDRLGGGIGTLSATGDVAIDIKGDIGGDVIFSGHFEANEGRGTWSGASSGNAGTWSVNRRAGVTVDASLRATCEAAFPCTTGSSADLTMVNCIVAHVLPSPATVLMSDRISACKAASTCDALWTCYGAGNLSPVYVSPTGNDANDGASPSTAKQTINAGIAVTQAGGTLRIATGTYRENVLISRSVTIQGGYDATFATLDPVATPVVIDGRGLDATLTAFVATASKPLSLKGLKIINGLASGGLGYNGGGLRIASALTQVTIADCTFSGNHAAGYGGAMAVSNSVLTVSGTTIESNNNDGSYGGGIFINRVTATLTSTTLHNNHSAYWGGGLFAWNSGATIEGSTITENQAGQDGGGIFISSSGTGTVSIKNSTLSGNTPNAVKGTYTDLGGNAVN